MRRGFTLLEVMLAVSIFATVVASLGAVAVGVRKLIGRAYAEAELSVRLRGLREKILFHAVPPHNGKVFAGLLSGAPAGANVQDCIQGNGLKAVVRAGGLSLADGSSFDQTIELVREDSEDSAWFKNDGETGSWRTGWLSLVFDGETSFEASRLDKNIYFVNLTATQGGVTQGLRLAVPVFGTEQEKNASSVFHDNLLQ